MLFKLLFAVAALVLIAILVSTRSALAIPLDPSSIRIGEIVREVPVPVLVGGGAVGGAVVVAKVRKVVGWWFADGHVEMNRDDNKKK